MADRAESSRRAPPMTPPPPPPSPTIPEDSSNEAILWAASDDCSSSTPHTDLLSLWLSNYAALPQFEAEEEPLVDVPTLLNFDLEASFPDLVDWNTTSAVVTQAPVAPQPVWVQLHSPAAGEVDDLSRLALGIQSPKASISPLALGIQPPQVSSRIMAPQASLSPLGLSLQSPPASFRIQLPQVPISPLALRIQSPQISLGIQSAPASFSSLPPIPCTLPMAPPLWNFRPSSSPVTERLSWNVLPSTRPPARQQSVIVSSPSSHPSHQTRHFFPAANTGHQQHLPVAHPPVTFSTANANASFSAGFAPASQPSRSPLGSWTPNQPWISSGQDMRMKLPIPRRPRFLLPPAATMMPAPPPLLSTFGSSVGNMPSWKARGDVPVGDQQRVQMGESSRPRKRTKLALDPSISKASHWSHKGARLAPIAQEMFAPELALNRNGKRRALPGTATDSQSLFSRYQREKIRQRVKILQRLVPNGDKAEMAILLEQAYIYIKFLEQQIKLLKSNKDWKLATPFVYNNMDLLHPQ